MFAVGYSHFFKKAPLLCLWSRQPQRKQSHKRSDDSVFLVPNSECFLARKFLVNKSLWSFPHTFLTRNSSVVTEIEMHTKSTLSLNDRKFWKISKKKKKCRISCLHEYYWNGMCWIKLNGARAHLTPISYNYNTYLWFYLHFADRRSRKI